MEEAGACDVRDGRTHLLACVDHVHSERVDGIPPVEERSHQAFIQRPVHSSHGRVKQNVDGCLFVWMGKKKKLNCYVLGLFFNYLVYGSAYPIFQDLEEKKKIEIL